MKMYSNQQLTTHHCFDNRH